jgi:Flp pilus assembly protein TadD
MDAVRWLRQAVAGAPDNPAYHLLLGDAYVRLGSERHALEHYRLGRTLTGGDAAQTAALRLRAAGGQAT